MPYAIHERGFEYNDEYFEIHNALSLHQTYSDRVQATKAWVLLERGMLDEVALLNREPFMELDDVPRFQILLDKLAQYNIHLDKAIKEQLMEIDGYADNEQLQLGKLTDEQLLDILLETHSHVYYMTQFDEFDEPSRYVLQFCHPELVEWNITANGYLPNTYFDDWYGICDAPSIDELMASDFFEHIEPDVPLITSYQTEDSQNPLLKGLLEQYDKHFDLIENEHRTELHYLGGSTQALRAVNEVL